MSTNSNAATNSNVVTSLYIPTVKSSYTSEKIMFLFWTHGLGKVDRVDFTPIIKANNKECVHFKQAFLYVDPMSAWHPDIVKSIEEGTSYKVYPNKWNAFEHLRDNKEYWIILKNKSPVPYTTTKLNVHQLANNLALLESLFAEKELRLAEKELRIAELETENAKLKGGFYNLIQHTESKVRNNESDNDEEYEDEDEEKYCAEMLTRENK